MAHSNRFIPVVLFLISCSPVVVPTLRCSADAECGDGLVCTDGKCVTQPSGCRDDQTRPCGPDPVGACRQGVQHCVAGAFVRTCTGAVTPTAELCNAIDDDCNGTVDDGVLVTFFVDRDGDGFGSSASGAESQQACLRPIGFAASSTDCDDINAAINPSAREVCDPSAVDEDCSGSANDNCGCSNVGMSQVCCAGRGSQICEARDGGATLLSLCTVAASREICNGIDDDCDGQTDELYSLNPEGEIVLLTDGGAIHLDGGCTVGLGACARSAGSVCSSGSLACGAVAGTPGAEICNGIDDDCDGMTDEASPALCSITGQSCTQGICVCPSGQSICGTSCQTIGGSCTNGTGACSRQGSVLCTSGSATCDAVVGMASAEICNGIDDDCDGMTDEASATLCAAAGQSCSVGTCSCPSGQSVCGTSCQTLGGSCFAGVGACRRTGAIACISGGAACNVAAGMPVAEICDGVDNDCNGTIDNGVTITCYPDEDNDRYATVATASQQCPDPSRIGFGSCPAGFVAPAASPGLDCAAADSFAYVVVSTRADADRDTACSGLPVTQCIGAFLPFGQRKTFDCNPTDDCNDTNANVFRLMSTRADGDADTYCAGASDSTCVGASAPAGRRFAFACSGDDCNDSSSAVFRWLSVRADADNDGYCIGSTFSQCSGTFPGAGKRLPSGCQAIDDCKDSNANATVSCFLAGAYQTTSAIKQCGVGFSFSENRTVTGGVPPCPVGFSRINAASLLNYTGNPGGACVVTGDTTLTMSCPSLTFGTFQCSIQADCTAN